MARLGDNTRHAPGPGDLTRTGDPQWETPGRCEECEGDHPVSLCPADRPPQPRSTCTRCGQRPTFAAGFPCPECAREIRKEHAA